MFSNNSGFSAKETVLRSKSADCSNCEIGTTSFFNTSSLCLSAIILSKMFIFLLSVLSYEFSVFPIVILNLFQDLSCEKLFTQFL